MYIKELQLNDFKSFHEQKFLFNKGLTVVTGSNGSGKSNVFDSIVFALGNNSPKTLRYKMIDELIHKGSNAEFARVQITFDDDTTIERYVADGSSVFRLNGKRTTLEAITSFLQEYKVSCNGHNIVLQDDVKKIVEMSDVDRRKYIDEIANISKFDEQKSKALKNLEKVSEKIAEAKIVLTERKEWLDKLEKEKASAERYLYLERQKLLTEATIIKKEKKQLQRDAASLSTRLTNLETELLDSSKKLSEAVKQIGVLELKLKEERIKFEEQNKDFMNIDAKLNVESYKKDSFEKELNELNVQKDILDENILELTHLKNNLNNEIDDINAKQKEIDKSESLIMKEIDSLGNLDSLRARVSQQEVQNKEMQDKLKIISNEIELETKRLREIEIKEAIQNQSGQRQKELDLELKELAKSIVKEEINYEEDLQITSKEIDDLEKERQTLVEKHDDCFEKKKQLDNTIIKLRQEIETLTDLDFKTQDPIFVSDSKEIDDFISKKEARNEFGTFVFLFKDKQDYTKNVVIKNILPSNKIKKLELELEKANKDIVTANKTFDYAKKELINTEKNLKSKSDVVLVLQNKIKNRDVLLLQMQKRQKVLEDEKSRFSYVEYSVDKSNVAKKIDSLIKEKEKISNKISSEDINKLSRYFGLVEKKNEFVNHGLEYNVRLARSEERLISAEKEISESTSRIKSFNDAIKVLSEKLNHQVKIVSALLKDKKEFEERTYALRKTVVLVEEELNNTRNEKNNLNDFIVKSEADKEHIKESIFLKEKLLDDKIKEIKEFVELNKNKDIDFETLDDREQKGISDLRVYIIDVKTELEGLGSVNLKAIEDYNDICAKYTEIKEKMDILEVERLEVSKDIEKISLEKEKIFYSYFTKLKTNFKRITKEFGLGDIDLILTDKNLDVAGIQIAIKRGSHERNLSSLSGGEKSLTTIAFILSIVEFEPSPFYLFDEVDAALDFKNTEKVLDYLKKLSQTGQIIMISHNPESVDMADNLIGISKNRLGITTIAVKQNKTSEVAI